MHNGNAKSGMCVGEYVSFCLFASVYKKAKMFTYPLLPINTHLEMLPVSTVISSLWRQLWDYMQVSQCLNIRCFSTLNLTTSPEGAVILVTLQALPLLMWMSSWIQKAEPCTALRTACFVGLSFLPPLGEATGVHLSVNIFSSEEENPRRAHQLSKFSASPQSQWHEFWFTSFAVNKRKKGRRAKSFFF